MTQGNIKFFFYSYLPYLRNKVVNLNSFEFFTDKNMHEKWQYLTLSYQLEEQQSINFKYSVVLKII